MNLFETVKASVSVPDAAKMYGLQPNRHGMVRCPFHDDRHPSLKLNEDYFYCFGCGAAGDVIDLTARLFSLRPYEAAKKLAADFGIDPDKPPSAAALAKPKHPMIRAFREDERYCQRVLCDFWKVLLNNLDAFQEYIQLTRRDKTISSMRENNLLLKPVTQMALAHVARMAKNKNLAWEDIVEKLNKISWSFDNELWFNLLVIGSANKKMITGKEAVRGVGMVISYLVMGDKMTKAELADVKTIYGNAKNNPDEPLPPMV